MLPDEFFTILLSYSLNTRQIDALLQIIQEVFALALFQRESQLPDELKGILTSSDRNLSPDW